jgi:hypothetical protein
MLTDFIHVYLLINKAGINQEHFFVINKST